jgi:hypothetical protein
VKYNLKAEVTISSSDPLLGAFEVTFPAGRTTPKSETEEAAFEKLVEGGFAERVPETKAEKEQLAAAEED